MCHSVPITVFLTKCSRPQRNSTLYPIYCVFQSGGVIPVLQHNGTLPHYTRNASSCIQIVCSRYQIGNAERLNFLIDLLPLTAAPRTTGFGLWHCFDPESSFRLPFFHVRTFMQIGQHASLVRIRESRC